MALVEREQVILDAIERAFEADDPNLASLLAGRSALPQPEVEQPPPEPAPWWRRYGSNLGRRRMRRAFKRGDQTEGPAGP